MKTIGVVLAFAALAFVRANCPHNCNGHGACGENSKCHCYPSYQGADCSERKCPQAYSWGQDSTDQHGYEECSGRGICNRASGVCACSPGFSGSACQRKTCPNNCSGHGECKPLEYLKNADPTTGWDSRHIQVCECDGNFFGPDCSKRHCPMGDDPNTHCLSSSDTDREAITQEITYDIPMSVNGPYKSGGTIYPPYPSTGNTRSDMPSLSSDIWDMINAEVAGSPVLSPSPDYANEQMHLVFKDQYGQNYSTQSIGHIFGTSASSLETEIHNALTGLPNQLVADATVTVTSASGRASYDTCSSCSQPSTTFRVEYNADQENANLVGDQNLLVCPSAYSCGQAGCRPHVRAPFAVRYVGHDNAVDYENAFDNNDGVASSSASTDNIDAENYNGDAYAAFNSRKIVLMADGSDPRLPFGMEPNIQHDGLERFDARIEVLVVDPKDGTDNTQDLWYYKVGFYDAQGEDNADGSYTGSSYEFTDKRFMPSETVADNQKMMPTPTTKTSFVWNGYTAMGPLPLTEYWNVPVKDFPGVYLFFKSPDMVDDGEMRVFEIAYKLPRCTVSEYTGSSNEYKLGTYVELQECSGRGSCDYKSGECSCFEGYYGLACSVRTTIV